MKPKSFTIDRKIWSNAETHRRLEDVGRHAEAHSKLLDEHGRMCCLGFYALACGVPKESIENVSTPDCIIKPYRRLVTGMVCTSEGSSDLATDLMSANDEDTTDDGGDITPKQREKSIRDHFKKIGVAVRFTGAYPRPRPRRKKHK